MPGKFFELDSVAVDVEIALTKFECDLSKCKGACCTMESDFGAPVNEAEIEIIEKLIPVLKDYLPPAHYKAIEKSGFWYRKMDHLMISSINRRECVFSYYDDDVAKCAIEKAYREGKVDFMKPISCHLFPIRIGEFGGDVLRFEEYTECGPALEKGKKTGMNVIRFCKDSLIRKYGDDWYKRIKELTKS